MDKIVLGSTKGKFEDQEFDIMDNIISMVDDYKKKLRDIEVSAQKDIDKIEKEKKKKIFNLKSDFKKRLGENNG